MVLGTTEYSGDVYDTMSNDNGWVVYGDGNEYSNDRINFSVTPADASSGSDRDQVLIDLDTAYGAYPAGDFVSTFELRFDEISWASGTENRVHIGFFDSSDWGGSSQDVFDLHTVTYSCLLYTSPSPRD